MRRPLLATSTSVTSTVIARLAGSVRPCSRKATGRTCHCRSGAASRGSLRANPPASAMFEVSGPLWVIRQRAKSLFRVDSHRPFTPGVDQSTGTAGWSIRFAPTAGMSAIT